ncbi:MAG TPA: hypothetical protein VHY83_11815 [Solirubrobacteraceae bacterium]|jgi:hypothetical protein|nr:hypothetical protein [Solirubrobacteraceae bacterium]
MSADPILKIVEELTDEGTDGFRASAIARQLGLTVEQVSPVLLGMVSDGRLRLRSDVICPDNGRTIRSYWQGEQLPIGKTVQSDRCASDEPFVVTRDEIWITFVPTEKFRVAVRKRRVQRGREERIPAADEGEPGLAGTTTRCRPTSGAESSVRMAAQS